MAFKMETPNYLTSSGHVAHFTEPDRNALHYQSSHPGILKFQGLDCPPFVRFKRTGNDTFTAFGPWFSLVYETAKKLNYSLDGLGLQPGCPEEQIWLDLIAFLPDILLIPFTAQFDTMLKGYVVGWIEISHVISTSEMDHILSARKYKTDNLMSLLTPFDFTSLVLMFTGLILISYLARFFKRNSEKTPFHEVIWNLATALICSPKVTAKAARWRLVGLSWLFGVFLLQQLFSGDMYTAMTLAPGLDVIDNLEDLALKTSGPIKIYDLKGSNINNVVSPYREHRDRLMKRIQVLPLEHATDPLVLEQVLQNVSKGSQFHLAPKLTLDMYRNILFDGKYKESLYISKEFSQPLPVFLMFRKRAEKRILEVFNVIIDRMQESGIFTKWVASYLNRWDDDEDEDDKNAQLVDFTPAHLKHFNGLFVICTGILGLSILAAFLEMNGKKKRIFKYRSNSVHPDINNVIINSLIIINK